MPEVVVALGSNIGEPISRLQQATREIGKLGQVVAISRIYETAPMYLPDQPTFANACVLLNTVVGPRHLLAALKQIEWDLGRQRRERNGPREIDLDLIVYGSLRYRYVGPPQSLEIPHPRAGERRFVLAPMADLGAHRQIPGVGTVQELMMATEAQSASVREVIHAHLPIPGN